MYYDFIMVLIKISSTASSPPPIIKTLRYVVTFLSFLVSGFSFGIVSTTVSVSIQ